METNDDKILILTCCSSFYVHNSNGSFNRKIPMGSKWLDLGIENSMHKLKRIDRIMKNPYAYIKKNKIVENFKIEGVYHEWKI